MLTLHLGAPDHGFGYENRVVRRITLSVVVTYPFMRLLVPHDMGLPSNKSALEITYVQVFNRGTGLRLVGNR